MLENPNFEHYYYSTTAEGIYKTGYESFRLIKLLICYDRFYHENMNYYKLMGFILKYLDELS